MHASMQLGAGRGLGGTGLGTSRHICTRTARFARRASQQDVHHAPQQQLQRAHKTEQYDELISRLTLLRRERSVAAQTEQYELACQLHQHLQEVEADLPKTISAALDSVDQLLSTDRQARLAATRDLWSMPGYAELPRRVDTAVKYSFMRGFCRWRWSRRERDQIADLAQLLWTDPELCDERWLASTRRSLAQALPDVQKALAEAVAVRGQQVSDRLLVRKALKKAQAQSVWELERGRSERLGQLSDEMAQLRSSYRAVFAAGSAVAMAAAAVPGVQQLHPDPAELQLLYSLVGLYLAGVVGAYCRCLRRSVTLFRSHDAALNYEGVLGEGAAASSQQQPSASGNGGPPSREQ